MLPDGNRPKVGPGKKMLGVKTGSGKHDDIAQDKTGNVHPGTGGMSVVRAWRELPPHRIPERLTPLCPNAAGSNKAEIWYMGEGPFQSESITGQLNLRVDSAHHGMLEPAGTMMLADYQQSLADTVDQWRVDPATNPSSVSKE